MSTYLKDHVHLWSIQLRRTYEIENEIIFPSSVSKALFEKTLENCGIILSMVEHLIETNDISKKNLKLIEEYFKEHG